MDSIEEAIDLIVEEIEEYAGLRQRLHWMVYSAPYQPPEVVMPVMKEIDAFLKALPHREVD